MTQPDDSSTKRHSPQELLLQRLAGAIISQEDKLAELRHALNTLTGSEDHASQTHLDVAIRKAVEKFEESIEQLRSNISKQGGQLLSKKEHNNAKPLSTTNGHTDENERKRQIQRREQKNKKKENER